MYGLVQSVVVIAREICDSVSPIKFLNVEAGFELAENQEGCGVGDIVVMMIEMRSQGLG